MGCILIGIVLRPILFYRVYLVGLKNGRMENKGEKIVGVGVQLKRENMKDFGVAQKIGEKRGTKTLDNNVPLDILFCHSSLYCTTCFSYFLFCLVSFLFSLCVFPSFVYLLPLSLPICS